jgi:hypothetical protein
VTATFNIAPGSHSIYNNDPAATFMSIAFGNAQTNSYAYAEFRKNKIKSNKFQYQFSKMIHTTKD